MAKTSRWMTWVLDESAKSDVDMPWARGQRGTSLKDRLAAEAPELSYSELKSA